MVSITTYVKDEIKVILFTEIRGKEYSRTWSIPKDKGDSTVLKELKAVRLGLEHMTMPVELEIYVGHPSVVTALNVWIKEWQQNGWKKSDGKEVKNKEILEKIAEDLNKHPYIVKLKEEKKHEIGRNETR